MKREKIDRINELYKKQKSIGLTEEEKIEQNDLRQEYIQSISKNFKQTMNSVKIKDEKGKIIPLRPKKKR